MTPDVPATPERSPPTPDTDQGRLTLYSTTCGKFHPLDICELAHRDVTGKRLCLNEEDLDVPSLRVHLRECESCNLWYRNSSRTYERLSREFAMPEPVCRPPYEPQERRPQPVRPAAGGPGIVHQLLEPLPGARDLDAHSIYLLWHRGRRRPTDAKGDAPWSLTLQILAQQIDQELGSPEPQLRQLSGSGVRVELRSGSDEVTFPTHLDFDFQGRLVSHARRVERIRPTKVEGVRLKLLGKVPSVDAG